MGKFFSRSQGFWEKRYRLDKSFREEQKAAPRRTLADFKNKKIENQYSMESIL